MDLALTLPVRMPPVCVGCGGLADAETELTHSEASAGPEILVGRIRVHETRLKLPICASCKKRHDFPIYIALCVAIPAIVTLLFLLLSHSSATVPVLVTIGLIAFLGPVPFLAVHALSWRARIIGVSSSAGVVSIRFRHAALPRAIINSNPGRANLC